jgi:hypothetical protein
MGGTAGVNTVFDHCLEISGVLGGVNTVFDPCLEVSVELREGIQCLINVRKYLVHSGE